MKNILIAVKDVLKEADSKVVNRTLAGRLK
jgi:hypothetical protein